MTIIKTAQRIEAESRHSAMLDGARDAQAELKPRAEAACRQIQMACQGVIDAINEYIAVENESMAIGRTVEHPRRVPASLPMRQSARLQDVRNVAESVTLGEGLRPPVCAFLDTEHPG